LRDLAGGAPDKSRSLRWRRARLRELAGVAPDKSRNLGRGRLRVANVRGARNRTEEAHPQ